MEHLAGHAQSFGRRRHRQPDRRQDIFLYDLARMDRRQSVLSAHISSLMVVFKIDIQSIFTRPAESDPVIPSHAHRPALRAALQAVEAKSCDVYVLPPPPYIQPFQDWQPL